MNEYKILFTGTMGAGKTTAIGAVSDTAPIVTDVHNSDSSVQKERTTVGLDFGEFSLDNGDRVRLFGTPGQNRFDFLWKILAKNALGLIILIDNSRPDPLADLGMYLDGFADQLDTLPCAVGVGRLETHPTPTLDDYIDELSKRNRIFPVLDVDVRRKDDVVLLIDTLLAQIEANLHGEQP
ncbi:GTP-binding protein [Comamonas serinivorans]|uniref:GTP-binding protein n=1 Tax=Comamonas serinivorans TaxID=1082851 RepID=A0A1Y0ES43_9BURK|nr:GTP-binding protein [Comamonas serinivorans]ARU06072.1 GTP-binding protein [Comamonas serinivorans]